MAKIDKEEDRGNEEMGDFLRADDMRDGSTFEVVITGEAKITEAEYDDGTIGERLSIPVHHGKAERTMSVGKRFRNKLIDALGDETSEWVGKILMVLVQDYPSLGHHGFIFVKVVQDTKE